MYTRFLFRRDTAAQWEAVRQELQGPRDRRGRKVRRDRKARRGRRATGANAARKAKKATPRRFPTA